MLGTRTYSTVLLLTVFGGASIAAQRAAGDDLAEIAKKGTALVKARCYGCHGEKFNGSAQLNVMDSSSLVEHRYVIEGNVAESPLWLRVVENEMPPEETGGPALTATEKETLRAWIDAGAPQVIREDRHFKSYPDVIRDLHADLSSATREERPFYRYLSLAHLSNNSAVTNFDLRLYRAALVKTINSLSYESEIYVPAFIDLEHTIFRIDLRRLGWSAGHWTWVVERYPYGIHFANSEDDSLAGMAQQIDLLTGCELCWLRADWFINTALRPPFYDYFLKIPVNVLELESRLNVDVERNIDQNRVARAGFASSGVSVGNRLVERHPAIHGYYWKSYDFKDSGQAGNLFRLPLGPPSPRNKYPDLAFEHDGGEMIFSLPNGLQGYMLSDQFGRKLDVGPIEVVRDSKETAGTPVVVNGLSCVHCHRHGLIDFQDTVRTGAAVFGEAKRKVRNLHPQPDEMAKVIAADRGRFMSAAAKCTAPFFDLEPGNIEQVRKLAEPIGAVARYYQRDLTVESAACELGVESAEALRLQIELNRDLQRIGLSPLTHGQTIKRSAWEDRSAFVSQYQKAIRFMGLATPIN